MRLGAMLFMVKAVCSLLWLVAEGEARPRAQI